MNHLSTAQLSVYLQVTKRTIQRRSIREGWPHIEVKGLGGTRRMYVFSALPTSVKNSVIAQIIVKHEQQGLAYSSGKQEKSAITIVDSPFIVASQSVDGDWLSQHIFAEHFLYPIDDIELDKEYVKIGLLELAYCYVQQFSLGKIEGYDQFCRCYNNRELALKKAIYKVVRSVSRITLLRWEKQLKEESQQNRLFKINNRLGGGIDSDFKQIAKELLMTSPNLTAESLIQYFSIIFPARKPPDKRCLNRWLTEQKQQAENACSQP